MRHLQPLAPSFPGILAMMSVRLVAGSDGLTSELVTMVNDTFIDINAGFKWDINDSMKLNYEYTSSEYRSSSVGCIT